MENDGILILALARMRFLRTREKLLLYDVLGSPDTLAGISREDASGIVGRQIRSGQWSPGTTLSEAGADERFLTHREISYTFYWNEDYPPLLRETFDPPFVLFFRGNLPDREKPAVAVVGTRRPTGSGQRAAHSLAFDLGAHGIEVVSGLARGIDKAAHEGAVQGGGKTFAVLGCGIETVYPKENRNLADRILSGGGGLLSEYPPGAPALKFHFPERNRIISGLSRAVVVVEAPEKSGALITADYALEQGRDVYVHRDGLKGEQGAGTGRLLLDGAGELCGAAELLHDWGISPETVRSAGMSGRELPETPGGAAQMLSRNLELELRGMRVRR